MSNERFTLTADENSMWTVSDKESGFSIKFREGLFNETQEVVKPDTLPDYVNDGNVVQWAARTMREFGDWMAENHKELSMCDIESRRMAI